MSDYVSLTKGHLWDPKNLLDPTHLPGYTGLGSDIHIIVLEKLHSYLMRHIMFDSVHDTLISEQAFDAGTLDDMKEEHKNSGKIRCLLDNLKKGDHKTYNIFKAALRNTNQGHIVEHLETKEKEQVRAVAEKRFRDQQTPHQSRRSEKVSEPREIPSSPIAQPTPSLQGSPGFANIHEKHVQDP